MECGFGFGKNVDMNFDAAIEKVTADLQTEGFGVLSDIDVAAKMKEKLGEDMPRYRILGPRQIRRSHHRPAIRRSRFKPLAPFLTSVCCCPAMSWFVKTTKVGFQSVSWTRRACWRSSAIPVLNRWPAKSKLACSGFWLHSDSNTVFFTSLSHLCPGGRRGYSSPA